MGGELFQGFFLGGGCLTLQSPLCHTNNQPRKKAGRVTYILKGVALAEVQCIQYLGQVLPTVEKIINVTLSYNHHWRRKVTLNRIIDNRYPA